MGTAAVAVAAAAGTVLVPVAGAGSDAGKGTVADASAPAGAASCGVAGEVAALGIEVGGFAAAAAAVAVAAAVPELAESPAEAAGAEAALAATPAAAGAALGAAPAAGGGAEVAGGGETLPGGGKTAPVAEAGSVLGESAFRTVFAAMRFKVPAKSDGFESGAAAGCATSFAPGTVTGGGGGVKTVIGRFMACNQQALCQLPQPVPHSGKTLSASMKLWITSVCASSCQPPGSGFTNRSRGRPSGSMA